MEAQIFPVQESNEVVNHQWVDIAFTIQNVEEKELEEDSADWLGHSVIRNVSQLVSLPVGRIRVRKLHRNLTLYPHQKLNQTLHRNLTLHRNQTLHRNLTLHRN